MCIAIICCPVDAGPSEGLKLWSGKVHKGHLSFSQTENRIGP